MPASVINVGVLVIRSPGADVDRLTQFAERAVADARERLEEATQASWRFDLADPRRLDTEETRMASDFLDEASLTMVEGPYDIVLVVTDVGLTSRRRAVVGGLASRAGHVAVLSTRKLLSTPRGRSPRSLDDESVRWNAATLLVHLVGHIVGVGHSRGDDVMAPWGFDEARAEVPPFSARHLQKLPRLAQRVHERTLRSAGALPTFAFHLREALRHPRLVLVPALRSRAPILTLSLPGLVTAALVPTFILIFTAEIWDVGLALRNEVAWTFAGASVFAAAWYLTAVQNLFFPREEKRTLTSHMAVINATIFLTILLAMLGLFAMVVALMLFVEFYVFPPDLIATWPTLEDPEVTVMDKVRLAGFVTSIATLTGALAGGFEKRAALRQLALFEENP